MGQSRLAAQQVKLIPTGYAMGQANSGLLCNLALVPMVYGTSSSSIWLHNRRPDIHNGVGA